MKLYFLENVLHVAKKGEIKEVSAGYASNFLLPKKLAKICTPELESRLKQGVQKKEQDRRVLLWGKEEILEKLAGAKLVFSLPATDAGKVYGSISEKEIAELLDKKYHLPLTKKHILLHSGTFKKLGEDFFYVDLGNNKSIKLPIEIVRQ
jgi:large subunit ribosomal protein L9